MRTPLHLAVAVATLAQWPLRVVEARATMRRLASLDARSLADIGLTPADLNDATALPLAADPGFFLAARVAAGRVARLPPDASPRRLRRRFAFARTGS